ncbi:MAG: response regulator [Verrucomicrobiales bacterium]|nr:response regulator [Verrucomicrobiales bacterium]
MRIKVLTIDDESSFTSLIRMNLEREGEFEVQEENDPTYALSVAREFCPHVILLDMVMPGLTGAEIAELFGEDPNLRRIPIVMLTALVSRDESGDDEFFVPQVKKVLPKPVDLATLKNTLFEVVANDQRPAP